MFEFIIAGGMLIIVYKLTRLAKRIGKQTEDSCTQLGAEIKKESAD